MTDANSTTPPMPETEHHQQHSGNIGTEIRHPATEETLCQLPEAHTSENTRTTQNTEAKLDEDGPP